MDIITDYDEFGIYSDREEIENYIKNLIDEGFEEQEEIYNLCLEKFGIYYIDILDELFSDED